MACMKIPTLRAPRARGLLAGLAVLSLLAPAATATWSIIAVNTRTREVSIGCATCLGGFTLKNILAVVRVGEGGGCVQSAIDGQGANRRRIWDGLIAGDSPQEILDLLSVTDGSFEGRQYGIVDMTGLPVSRSGSNNGAWAGGVAGIDGDIRYAIQGNVLTGAPVVAAAEQALLNTPGDLGQRVIAAMEAARAMGGDGRCSCGGNPVGCGSPPPSFDRTAIISSFVWARVGDVDGICQAPQGCATGDYFLVLDDTSNAQFPDPVNKMQVRFANWRATKVGVPDQVLSSIDVDTRNLVADGVDATDVTLTLRDIDGVRVPNGGHAVSVVYQGATTAKTSVGPVTDNGDGTYSFRVTAGTDTGIDVWRVIVDDGVRPVHLQPAVEIRSLPVETAFYTGFGEIRASEAPAVPLFVRLDPSVAGWPYAILGSASGTAPGTPFAGTTLPLNRDRFFRFTSRGANGPRLRGTLGTLDGAGRARGAFSLSARELAPWVGRRLDWSAVVFGPRAAAATGAFGFDVRP